MNTRTILAIAACVLTSVSLCAQEANANSDASATGGAQVDASARAGAAANTSAGGAETNLEGSGSAKTTYAPAPAAWGDEAASHAWEMSSISGRLESRLDSKSAQVGDRVVLRTTEKAQTSDGTVIPAGSRLVGHVTAVQALDKQHAASQIGIAFDRVERKGGESVAVYTMIRGVTQPAYAAASGGMYGDVPMGADIGGGRTGAGGGVRGGGLAGGGSALGAAGGVTQAAGGLTGDAMNGAEETASPVGGRTSGGMNSTANSAVELAGHGDPNVNTGAHALAAARATPHPTGIPGVMLAGGSTASGVFSATGRNIELESGTQMQLGIVANR